MLNYGINLQNILMNLMKTFQKHLSDIKKYLNILRSQENKKNMCLLHQFKVFVKF